MVCQGQFFVCVCGGGVGNSRMEFSKQIGTLSLRQSAYMFKVNYLFQEDHFAL